MLRASLCALAALLPAPALAGAAEGTCDTALVLAIDVSNSVDGAEYRLQIDGLADALRDPELARVMVEGRVAVTVMQWSDEERQQVSISWEVIGSSSQAMLLSARVRALPRVFEMAGTAPAEAVWTALALLEEAPPCGRQVIDVSGDGPRNSGGSVPEARDAAHAAGVTINGIAIETQGREVSTFYMNHLVTPGGFVLRARGHSDYPRSIREKLLRELGSPVG
jgi:Ca-activated chloride channel family protein